MKDRLQLNLGFSLIELMIGVAIGGILIAATSIFFGRGVSLNRLQFQQVLITEDARTQLERVTDELRNARNTPEGDWLIAAEDYNLALYSNIDDDAEYEAVRYSLEETNLRRGITEQGDEERIRTVARSLRNGDLNRPLFAYFDSTGNQIEAASATSDNVYKIQITLLVDTNPDRPPGAAEVITVIIPRQKLLGGSSGSTTESLWPVTLNYPSQPANGTDGTSSGSDQVEVTVTNPSDGSSTTQVIPIAEANDGRLATYTNSYYVHINYQPVTIDGDLPGWYAWIGPIKVGQSGSTEYFVTDKMPVSELCTGSDLSVMLTECAERTVSKGSFSASYKPIVTYSVASDRHYIRNVLFNFGGSSPTPTPSVTPTPSPTPSPSPTPTASFTPTPTPSATPSGSPTPTPSPGTILLSDAFTGAQGSSLNGRNLDVGPTWTIGSGSWYISGNQAEKADDGCCQHVYADAGTADVSGQMQIRLSSIPDAGRQGFLIRYTDSQNYWIGVVSQWGGSIEIWKLQNGSWTIVNSTLVSFSPGDTMNLSFSASGNIIEFTANGVSVAANDTFNNTATRHGLWTNIPNGYTPALLPLFDNFQVSALSST